MGIGCVVWMVFDGECGFVEYFIGYQWCYMWWQGEIVQFYVMYDVMYDVGVIGCQLVVQISYGEIFFLLLIIICCLYGCLVVFGRDWLRFIIFWFLDGWLFLWYWY